MRSTATSIDAYIEAFPQEIQERLQQMRRVIQAAAPGATETISYAIPTFKLNGNLVHFAGYKRHIGFYPGADGIAHFEKDLSKYTTSKGAVQFPHDQALPLKLVEEMTRFRVKQQLEKKRK